MAGMARTGEVYPLNLPPELLATAFQNTVDLLKRSIVVEQPPAKASVESPSLKTATPKEPNG